MDTKTLIMLTAAGASLWALQQIKEQQTLKKIGTAADFATVPDASAAANNVSILLRVADAYAQAAENETDTVSKQSHWQAARNVVWVAKLLYGSGDDAEVIEQKLAVYSDTEAGMQNQLRDQLAAAAAASPRPETSPHFQNLEQQQQQPEEPPPPASDMFTKPSSSKRSSGGASFFPSATFVGEDTAPTEGGGGGMPEALQPIKTKTSKGEDQTRVQPYSSDL